MSTTTTTSTTDRAATLLGQGLGPEMVAAALGVSPSRISQLLAQEEFAARVAELRYATLSKHNERDATYDSLEDALLSKLQNVLPFMVDPMKIVKAISVLNGAKRRGASNPEMIHGTKTVVTLVLPSQITQVFTQPQMNLQNQVVQVGSSELRTIPSSSIHNLMLTRKEHQNVSPPQLDL